MDASFPAPSFRFTGIRRSTFVDSAGHYRVTAIPAGIYLVRVQKFGYAADSSSVSVSAGGEAVHDVRLHPAAAVLGQVAVTAQRLGESQAAALDRRQSAPNVVNVLAGDAIRELPNLNAAEAGA